MFQLKLNLKCVKFQLRHYYNLLLFIIIVVFYMHTNFAFKLDSKQQEQPKKSRVSIVENTNSFLQT